MAYDFYLGEMLFPIPPESIKTTIKSKNETVTLINDGEVSILKTAGLTTGSFTLLLPNSPYPFARYINGFKNAKVYLDHLETLKKSNKPFQWIISRRFPTGKTIFNTNLQVTLEDYTIKDDAKKAGFDILVDVKLKQYRPYSTKTYAVDLPPAIAPIVIRTDRQSSYNGNTNRTTRQGAGKKYIDYSTGKIVTISTEDSSVNTGNSYSNTGNSSTTKKKQTYTVQIPGMSALQTQAYSEAEAIKNVTPDYWKGTILVNGNSYDAATKTPVQQKGNQSTYTPTSSTQSTQDVAQKAVSSVGKSVTNTGSAISSFTSTVSKGNSKVMVSLG